jgi:hypothetical protein
MFQDSAVAINLTASSSSNVIYSNIISNCIIGINVMANSHDNMIYHNSFVANNEQIYISTLAPNTWDDGYPSGGNFWSGHVIIDLYNGPNQDGAGSDGINDTAYTIVTNNIDRYPLVNPFDPLDIGITNVTTYPALKTVVGRGSTVHINLKVLNYGMSSHVATLAAQANAAFVAAQATTLASHNLATITLIWNTTEFIKGSYTISGYAEPLQGETDTSDNTRADGIVLVTIPGDVNGDHKVRVDDVLAVALRFGTNYGGPPNSNGYSYDPNCDVNDDLKIRVDDVLTAATQFGQGPW